MIRVVDILNKKLKEKLCVCFDLFYIIYSNLIEVFVFVKKNDEKVILVYVCWIWIVNFMCFCVVNDEWKINCEGGFG